MQRIFSARLFDGMGAARSPAKPGRRPSPWKESLLSFQGDGRLISAPAGRRNSAPPPFIPDNSRALSKQPGKSPA